MTGRGTDSETVRIVRKAPVGWLNLGTLWDTGILAAISSATGNRTPRREALAALDMAVRARLQDEADRTGGNRARSADWFDYSAWTKDAFWFDFVADLGDGFDATHSIAWLVGRDCIGLNDPGDQPFPQPASPDPMAECGLDEFKEARHVLPAGRITVFGGDLVYPFATQTEYEDRTINPYYAARPWQEPGRHLYVIPGNHDWYDGLGAFVQRFCQPQRWMGCWEVQQRRSYFAIKLPHGTWLWGVDLATGDDFDAPQLEYFRGCAERVSLDEDVILCVPKPAWVDRQVRQTAGEIPDTDDEPGREPPRSWESWQKIDLIRSLIDRPDRSGPRRVRAILSGDLHHYSRYATPDEPAQDAMHLITCGGGGAYLLGTDALRDCVSLGDGLRGYRKAAFPSQKASKAMRWGVLKLPLLHKQLCLVLGAVMLGLVWFLESAAPSPLLAALRDRHFGGDFGRAFAEAVFHSPFGFLLLVGVLGGFALYAVSGASRLKIPAAAFGALHGLVQLIAAFLIAAYLLDPAATGEPASRAFFFLFGIALSALLSGAILSVYLLAANAVLGIHGQEVFSAQAIENWKCFLRIRVGTDGVTIYPVGLQTVCRTWTPLVPTSGQEDAPRPVPGDASAVVKAAAVARTVGSEAKRTVSRFLAAGEEYTVRKHTTHLFAPASPLGPQLIEDPITIARRSPGAGARTAGRGGSA